MQCVLLKRHMKEIFDIEGMVQESFEGDAGLNIIAVCLLSCLEARTDYCFVQVLRK